MTEDCLFLGFTDKIRTIRFVILCIVKELEQMAKIRTSKYDEETKPLKRHPEYWDEVCASCGKTFKQSQLGYLTDRIMKHKPACSYECNKALGQVK